MKTTMRAIWITWERQRRNRSMAAALGASLHELEYQGNALARYATLAWRTLRLVRQCQPEVIYYQNPSLVLAAFIATLKMLGLTRAKTVGDFHNAGVFPPTAAFLVPWIVRHTDLVIVSNPRLEPRIRAAAGRCMSIPDPVPQFHRSHGRDASRGGFDVFFVCSWAPDEPIDNVLRAAQMLEKQHPDITFFVTGRPKLEKIGWHEPVPGNVRLTGFLSDEAFEEQLADSSVVLDLTTRADCMVCGAYEAVAAEVPMIVSDNEPTRAYFHRGALYTDNSATSIAALILEMRARRAQLHDEVVALKAELLQNERTTLRELSRSLASISR
jgi:glycosyltransferase involved in cell wall biosynthesis